MFQLQTSVEPVRFVSFKNRKTQKLDVKGTHSSFTKIALVAYRYRGVRPAAGEDWICQVEDTQRNDPKHGVLVLYPVEKLARKTKYEVKVFQLDSKIFPTVYITETFGSQVLDTRAVAIDDPSKIDRSWPGEILAEIERKRQPESTFSVDITGDDDSVGATVWERRHQGQFDLGTRTHAVTGLGDIKPEWPTHITARLEAAYAVANWRQAHDEEQTAREVAHRQAQTTKPLVQSVTVEQSQLLSRTTLVNPQEIIVTKLTVTKHTLSLVPLNEAGLHQRYAVLVDGKTIGLTSNGSHASVPEVEVRKIELSNGETFTVASKSLEVFALLKLRTSYAKVFVTNVKAEVKDRTWLDWKEASTFTEGSCFAREYPFQWVGDWLTNGVIWFPRERPFGSDWRHYPIPSIPEECWQMFLKGLEGAFLDGLLPFYHQVTAKKERKPVMSARQKQLVAIVQGQMYKAQGGEHVEFLRNFLFIIERPGMQTLYFIDNPGVGALYYTTNEKTARKIANGQVARGDAMEHVNRIIHTTLKEGSTAKSWEAKVAEVVNTYDEQDADI